MSRLANIRCKYAEEHQLDDPAPEVSLLSCGSQGKWIGRTVERPSSATRQVR